MHEFPEYLASMGHDVTFIDFPEDESLLPYRWKRKEQVIAGRVVGNARLNLISLPRRFPRPIDRLVCAATFSWSAKSLVRSVSPDVIVLYAIPTNGWQMIRLGKKSKVPVVYRAIDSSANIRHTIFSSLVRRAERYVYRKADLVLTNNGALKEFGERYGADPSRTRVLFPGVAEHSKSDSVSQTIDDGCNVVFMGSLFRFSGLDWVMEGIAQSPELRKSIRLKIIGDGENRKLLEQQVDRLGIRKNVIFTGFVDFNRLYEEMSNCRVAILPFDDEEVARVALPGKVPQYVMAGLPTVAVPLAGLKSLLGEGEGVVYSDRGSEFLAKVAALLDDDVLRRSIRDRGVAKLRAVCAWPEQARRFEEQLIELAESRK